MKCLVTGSASGLGRHLAKAFAGAATYVRGTQFDQLRKERFDLIIHAAFNRCDARRSDSPGKILDDNICLTSAILDVPHRLFVFISSVDVYPRARGVQDETSPIDLDGLSGMYATTKWMAECLVTEKSVRPIVLRCGFMLGPFMRENSISRIVTDGSDARLSLAPSSSFNLITYADVEAFIRIAVRQRQTGIFNIVRDDNVTLKKVADYFRIRPQFGGHVYNSPKISNEKSASLYPELHEGSLQCLKRVYPRGIVFKDSAVT
ncbi:MAG: NAD-dependent epimerase/dehydratase family protein [Acidiferrobacteraceae bacterium]